MESDPTTLQPDQKNEYDTSDPVNSYIKTLQAIVTKPREFFAGMPKAGGYANPLIFGIIGAAISGFLAGVIKADAGQAIGGLVGGAIGFLIGSFIWGGILHLSSIIFADKAQGGFEATWRVGAYTFGATALVGWIPLIGILASFYGIYIAIMGIEQVHQTTTGKAAITVLAPVGVLFILMLLAALVLGAAILGALGMSNIFGQ